MKSERPHVGGVVLAIVLSLSCSLPAQEKLRPAKAPRPPSTQRSSLMREAAEALRMKDFVRAEKLFGMVAEEADLEISPMAWLTAELNRCHAVALQGRLDDAVAFTQQVVDECEIRLGAADPTTNEALRYLGFLLRITGKPEAAERVYRRNLNLLESKYGRRNFFVATAASRLAVLLQSLKRIEEAEALHRRALDIMRSTVGEDRPDACMILTNLADCLLRAGKKEEAVPIMDRAFAIVRATNNADLPSAGSILRTQAEFYRTVHQLDRAEELGRRAVERLAERHDWDRAKFFYYDRVKEVYTGILRDRGLTDSDIQAVIESLESSQSSAQMDRHSQAPNRGSS